MKAGLIILSLLTHNLGSAAESAANVASEFSRVTNPLAQYNGISGTAPKEDPLKTAEYDQKNLDLTARIWADSEISQKLCRPVGENLPKTFTSWWEAVNKYVASEKTRNAATKQRQAELQRRIDAPRPANYNFQTDAFLLQIEALNIMIDSLSGSSLSSDGQPSLSTSRIGSREELLVAVLKAQEATIDEDKEFQDAHNSCLKAIDESLDIATAANKYASTDCSKANPNSTVCSSLKSQSAQMINLSIPLFKKIPVVDLKELYEMPAVPSKEMNQRLLRILSMMKQQQTIFFAKSSDNKYDWLKPLSTCIEPIEKMIKITGIMCPTDAKDGKDYDQKLFDHLGRSDDIFKDSAHYMVNQKEPTGTPTYLHTRISYDRYLQEIKADQKNKNASPKELENLALARFWDQYLPSEVHVQNYLAGRAPSYGLDPGVEHQIAANIMRDNNQTEWTCSDKVCPTPLQPVAVAKPTIPDYAKVTESAKIFLDALGIKDALSVDMGIYLSAQWNSTDLIIGQSHQRQFYFKYVEDLLRSLIASDRSRLASLLLTRQTLLDSYNGLVGGLSAGTTIRNSNSASVSGAISGENTSRNNGINHDKDLSIQLAGVNLNPEMSMTKNELTKASNGQVSYLGAGVLTGNTRGVSNAINYSGATDKEIKRSSDKISSLQKRKNKSQQAADQEAYNSFSKKMKTKVDSRKISAAGSILSNGNENKPANADTASTPISSTDNYSTQDHSSFSNSSGYGGYSSRSSSPAVAASTLNSDQQRLSDAIDAKKSKNNEYYDSNEDDTIFSRVTKAYIRSYDKLK